MLDHIKNNIYFLCCCTRLHHSGGEKGRIMETETSLVYIEGEVPVPTEPHNPTRSHGSAGGGCAVRIHTRHTHSQAVQRREGMKER